MKKRRKQFIKRKEKCGKSMTVVLGWEGDIVDFCKLPKGHKGYCKDFLGRPAKY